MLPCASTSVLVVPLRNLSLCCFFRFHARLAALAGVSKPAPPRNCVVLANCCLLSTLGFAACSSRRLVPSASARAPAGISFFSVSAAPGALGGVFFNISLAAGSTSPALGVGFDPRIALAMRAAGETLGFVAGLAGALSEDRLRRSQLSPLFQPRLSSSPA